MPESGWNIKVHTSAIRLLGIEEAAVIYYLIDLRDQLGQEWVFCPVDRIKEDLGLSQKIQTRILNSLIGRELIETKKIGIPGRRSIRVDDGKLTSLIIEGKSS